MLHIYSYITSEFVSTCVLGIELQLRFVTIYVLDCYVGMSAVRSLHK